MSEEKTILPKQINEDEPCVRCVFHPYHIDSKGNIKREAFLPPNGKNDVSLFRLNYMSLDKCIEHGNGMSSSGKKFLAIASITQKDVSDNNNLEQNQKNGISADIYYAPMNKGNYVDKNLDVYIDDPNIDLPAHADLKYNKNLDGTVKTELRQYAASLAKKMELIYRDKDNP